MSINKFGQPRVEMERTDFWLEGCIFNAVAWVEFPGGVSTETYFTYTFRIVKSLRDEVRYRVLPLVD